MEAMVRVGCCHSDLKRSGTGEQAPWIIHQFWTMGAPLPAQSSSTGPSSRKRSCRASGAFNLPARVVLDPALKAAGDSAVFGGAEAAKFERAKGHALRVAQ